jgi:hypothetical protein
MILQFNISHWDSEYFVIAVCLTMDTVFVKNMGDKLLEQQINIKM